MPSQEGPRRQDRSHFDSAQAGSPLLSHATSHRSRVRLRHAVTAPITTARSGGEDRPSRTPGSRGCQLLTPACPPASVLDGLETLSRPRSHPNRNTGVTRSRLLSPTTKLVEHLGNAGRPRADANRAQIHQPNPCSRWFISRAPLTRQPHTGNAGLGVRNHRNTHLAPLEAWGILESVTAALEPLIECPISARNYPACVRRSCRRATPVGQ